VFHPGVYSTVQLSQGANYFKSGNYRFNSVDFHVEKHGNNIPTITFGYPDTAAGLALKIPNPGCAAAIYDDDPSRNGDPVPGATVYISGNTHFYVDEGQIEFLPRHQGGFDWVSIHALSSSNLTAGTGAEPVITTTTGAGKEVVVQGWLWAPNAWVNFGNVTGADAKVQLGGGTALARIHLGANATAGEFEVSVTKTPALSHFILTSTATKNGTTSITALVEYAPPNNVALRSWRVVN
jgi:hypothetical protein